jgi:hypothetical protein
MCILKEALSNYLMFFSLFQSLRQEIFRRLDRVPEIKHEPKLLNPTMEQYAKSGE